MRKQRQAFWNGVVAGVGFTLGARLAIDCYLRLTVLEQAVRQIVAFLSK